MPRKPKRWGKLSKKQRERVIKFAICYCEHNGVPIPEKVTRGTFAACLFYNVEWSGWIDRAAIKHIEAGGKRWQIRKYKNLNSR